MGIHRRQFSAALKAKIAVEGIKGQRTVQEIGSSRRAIEDGAVCADRETQGRVGLASKKVRAVAVGERREWIEAGHSELSVARQCQLSGLSRTGLYYEPRGESELNLKLMRLLDEQYTK